MKRLSIIGSTGSVGTNTLRVVEHLHDQFEVFALSARSNVEKLARQTAAFEPSVVAIADTSQIDPFVEECRRLRAAVPEVVHGNLGLCQIARAEEADIVVSAAVGAAGLEPTYSAVAAGKCVALANKEAMVLAGELLRDTARDAGALILPVDSEHNAIDQCLRSGRDTEIGRLILTASGGPFRNTPAEEFPLVTPDAALKHPTWQMGPRITIDSATLMNKGFEVIEARWLFDVAANAIDIVVHPQSIIHSMVEFVDGSIVAQLGTADMRQSIQYALTYPKRLPSSVRPLDWEQLQPLEFDLPDMEKFPCIGLAYRAIEMGGTTPAALNAADEIGVAGFLDQRFAFTDIARIIEETLDAHEAMPCDSVSAILEADRWAREFAMAAGVQT